MTYSVEYHRAYREANRERIRERKRAYYEANRERILERSRAYREANRERIRVEQRLSARKRTRRRLRELYANENQLGN